MFSQIDTNGRRISILDFRRIKGSIPMRRLEDLWIESKSLDLEQLSGWFREVVNINRKCRQKVDLDMNIY